MDAPPLLTRDECPQHHLRRGLRSGALVRLLPGVYSRSDVAHDPRVRAHAVCRWNRAAVVCGRAAAQSSFWPEISVPRVDVAASTNLVRPGYRFSRRDIPTDLRRSVDGLVITAPALTALDLAIETDGVAIDRVLRSRQARIADLDTALARTPYRRSNAARSRLLLDSRAEPWSVPERMMHALLRRARMTGWRANAAVVVQGRCYFLDVAWLGLRLAVEIDGRAFHTAADVFETDRVRQNDLVLAGWTVLRFTYHRVLDDPDGVLAEITRGCGVAARAVRR